MSAPGLEVVAPGVLTLVEDLGRPGWAHVGVGRAGAADPAALRLANRLVGNPEGAAGLEVLLGGLELRARGPVTVALTGAVGPAWVAGTPVGRGAVLELGAGEVLRVGTATRGLRTYVAVRGGFDVPAELGSRSSDAHAGIGPPPLAVGDLLPVGPAPVHLPPVDLAPLRPWPDDVVIRVDAGPHVDWFDDAPRVLCSSDYHVTPATDRVAVRLSGPALRRRAEHADRELAPMGLVAGAVQVPPDGMPIVFGPDHPVTGGYPVLAVVRTADLGALAQLRPGDPVRFRRT